MNTSWWTYRGSTASSRTLLRQHPWCWSFGFLLLGLWWIVVLPPVTVVRFMMSGSKPLEMERPRLTVARARLPYQKDREPVR